MSKFALAGILTLILALIVGCQEPKSIGWESVDVGLDLGSFSADETDLSNEKRIIVLRINPSLWQLELRSRSESGGNNDKSAKQWSEYRQSESEIEIVAAINAGMFNTDYSSHIGYMKSGEHTNNPHILRKQYLSAAVFGALVDNVPEFQIVDLDEVELDSLKNKYQYVIQNLRLIKSPGENRWEKQERQWSEAALAEDEAGNALFIFSRKPYSMFEFNEIILSLPLQIVRAQHLEGGPEAQLFYEIGNRSDELVGSFETGFSGDGNLSAWPIPNVIVVRKK